ncbi:unnamed protein product [Brachionus calyciflorus]|uniref:Uncharacterized protein n=1 Tax=Brachionus calyciflorus TaxID=104777 RepID=A0A813T2X0_9BILA|nr:unnamed protein product [Brachionus calyciflorus]
MTWKVYSILFYFLINVLEPSVSQTDDLDIYCDFIFFKKLLFCSRFTSLEQLDFRNTTIEYNELVIQPDPSLKLEFNSSLSFDGLKLGQNPLIEIGNFYKFDSSFNPFQSIQFKDPNKNFSLNIYDSIFEFKTNLTCEISEQNLQDSFLFSHLNIIQLFFDRVSFPDKICPLLFKNSTIKQWIFSTQHPIRYNHILNYTQGLLDIKVENLFVSFGLDKFVTIVNNENLLNEIIFESLKELEFEDCNLKEIDGESLSKFKNLTRIKLYKFDLKTFLLNGLNWMTYLNMNRTHNYIDIVFDVDYFPFDDSDLCIFEQFPFDNKIIPLFYIRGASLDFYLPCSCTIYWLYKNYKDYFQIVKNNKLFPSHCFNIPLDLIEEQFKFCNNENVIQNCWENSTFSEVNTTTPFNYFNATSCFDNPDQNADLCTCNLGSINILECTDSGIDDLPNDFTSQNKWDYVSFKGSSIKDIQNFNNLSLNSNATILVSKISNFGNDIFRDLSFDNVKFRFVIENSILNFSNSSFTFSKFSNFEFENCIFNQSLSIEIFEGSEIDNLIINQIGQNSQKPKFIRQDSNSNINVQKFKIMNLYSKFSPGLELNSNLLDPILFNKTSEIEILNTKLNRIDSKTLSELNNFQSIRLDNVNIGEVLKNYFKDLPQLLMGNNEVNFNDIKLNWLWNSNLKKVYFGNNNLLRKNILTQNENLCFFAGHKPSTKIYFYENLNSLSGLECTCTVYWIYRKINFIDLQRDPDLKYIPKCILKLNNSASLNTKLDECFQNNLTPLDTCKYLVNNETSTHTTNNLSTILESTTTNNEKQIKKLNSTILYLSIGASVLGAGLLITIGIILYQKKRFKIKLRKSTDTNSVALKSFKRRNQNF